ncbi:MAG: hypothetical protein WCD18_09585 [Thermosynechococcaceae cyanobacterium]
MLTSAEKRLEQYTLNHPQEVLLVKVDLGGEPDEITVFKGYSSSLMRQTAFDPDIPMLPSDAVILSIDRVVGPYNPVCPQFIQQGLDWDAFEQLLVAEGI